ncbi:MAG: hypothetical protein ACYDGY_06940, partial [Acidimicrobiales bacterium]
SIVSKSPPQGGQGYQDGGFAGHVSSTGDSPADKGVASRPAGHAGKVVGTSGESAATSRHRAMQFDTSRPDPATSDGLAIPAYDNLAASQVVRRLANLDRKELERISDYELHTRRRQTILNRTAQLLTR